METNLSEISVKIPVDTFSFTEIDLKILSEKMAAILSLPQCGKFVQKNLITLANAKSLLH